MVPVQRQHGVELVDALTKVAHRVSPDELLVSCQCGNYLAFCGVRVMAASMVEPGCGRCAGVRVMSDSVSALGRAVHLLPAGELFKQSYPDTPVAVCGALVTSGPDGDEVEPSYCPEWVSAALRWIAWPGVVW
jgi:hypothetical protein